MLKRGLVIVLILLLFVVACSEEEPQDILTTSAVLDVSTATIAVVEENGSIITEAEVYINGKYKGKTSKYGGGKGTKKIVLDGDENEIIVRKEGYESSEPNKVSATLTGTQFYTVTLRKLKTDVLVHTVPQARMVITSETAQYDSVADEYGVAYFKDIDDGNYTITGIKEGYDIEYGEVNVSREVFGDEVSVEVEYSKLAELLVEIVGEELLSGAQVSLYTPQGYNTPGAAPRGEGYTDESGLITFTNVGYEQEYVLVVKHAGYNAQIVDVSITPDEELVIVHMEEE